MVHPYIHIHSIFALVERGIGVGEVHEVQTGFHIIFCCLVRTTGKTALYRVPV